MEKPAIHIAFRFHVITSYSIHYTKLYDNHALNNINSHQNNTIDKKPMIVLIFSILKSEGKSFIIKHLIDQSNSNGIKSIGIVPSSEKISTLENNA